MAAGHLFQFQPFCDSVNRAVYKNINSYWVFLCTTELTVVITKSLYLQNINLNVTTDGPSVVGFPFHRHFERPYSQGRTMELQGVLALNIKFKQPNKHWKMHTSQNEANSYFSHSKCEIVQTKKGKVIPWFIKTSSQKLSLFSHVICYNKNTFSWSPFYMLTWDCP